MTDAGRHAPHLLLDQLFTSAPVGLAYLDTDLRYMRINDILAGYNGMPAADHIGRTVLEVLPRLAEVILPLYRHVLETGESIVDREVRSSAPDDEQCWLSSYFPVRDSDGTTAGVCTVVQDITARTAAETALRERLRFETLLADLTGAFVSAPAREVDLLISHHLQDIAEFLGIDRCVLWRTNRDRGGMRPTNEWHAPDVAPPPMDLTSDDFPDTAADIMRGSPITFSASEELEAEPGITKAYFDDQGIRSGMFVPLLIDGEVEAMLACGTIRTDRVWNARDIQLATLLGGVFASVLQRLRAENELRDAIDHVARLKDELEAECIVLRQEVSLRTDHREIIGQSEPMRQALFRAEQVAATDVTVLLQGETGTGKELFARAVHRSSRRCDRPLVTVNCAALPPTLIESELFGHERGAFTGADARRVGRFEVADGGTLFLDEIGELTQDLQVKLLRVLQEGEFQRLGSSRTMKADVRIIAATNRDLEAAVREGEWREDLWYRLNVFPIRAPALRERKEDIPDLVHAFVARFVGKTGCLVETVPKKVLEELGAYNWPGNVRELENVIERAVITSPGTRLMLADRLRAVDDLHTDSGDADRALEDVERSHLRSVLENRRWRIEGPTGAARALGLNPSTLRGRLRKLGIRRP